MLSLASGLCLCFNAVFSLFIGVVALDICKHQKLENFAQQTFLKGLFKETSYGWISDVYNCQCDVFYHPSYLCMV